MAWLRCSFSEKNNCIVKAFSRIWCSWISTCPKKRIGGLGANQTRSDAQNHPVIILTSSYAEGDVLKSYDNHANAYVTRPVDVEKYFTMSRPPR
jgi:hypothetical protein